MSRAVLAENSAFSRARNRPASAGHGDQSAGPSLVALKTEPKGPAAEGKPRAQVIFEQAVAAYTDARYFDAVEHLVETNRIDPRF